MAVWSEDHRFDDNTRYIVWISLWIFSYFVGICLLFGYFRFKKLSKLMIIQKRYPNIVLLESKFAIILTFLLIPFLQCTYSEFTLFIKYQKYIDIITYLIYPVCHFIVGCEVCRLWLMCYDLNYLHHSKNNSWKSQIDEKLTNTDNNWWLNHKNRRTYGNEKWVKRRLFLWGIISAAIACTSFQIWSWTPITQAFDALIYGLSHISYSLFSIYLNICIYIQAHPLYLCFMLIIDVQK